VIRPLLFLLALAGWMAGASQDQADPCVSGEPEPVLDAASPMIHSHIFRITGPRTAEESARKSEAALAEVNHRWRAIIDSANFSIIATTPARSGV
jgi:hypothetical protein